jgi:hypothetical protein
MGFRISRTAVAIFLLSTGFTPVHPSWAMDPQNPLPTSHFCEYLLNLGVHHDQVHFEEKIAIKTPQDALNFWKGVDQAVAAQRYSWRNLSTVDYARPLLAIRNQFSQLQIEQLFQIFDSLRTREYGYWEKVLLPVEILFKPELSKKYFDFQDDITEYAKNLVDGTNYAKDFTYATVTALSNLPQEQRNKMREFFLSQIHEFRKNPPLNKFTRRNAEILYRALFENEFQEFLSDLVQHTSSGKIDTRFATQRIEMFWGQLSFGSDYDFSDVLSVVEIIQDGPVGPFLREETIYLYGSFANGTAVFPKSDIDIHLSPNLEKLYEQTFGYDGTFAKPEDDVDNENLKPLQKAFFKLEKSMARMLGVRRNLPFLSGYMPGKFLSVSTGTTLFGPKDWFSPKYTSQQSPITIKISRNKVILQVFDAYRSRRLYEVELQ